eukprot:4575816-Pyramimonas_sp.AAC.1
MAPAIADWQMCWTCNAMSQICWSTMCRGALAMASLLKLLFFPWPLPSPVLEQPACALMAAG